MVNLSRTTLRGLASVAALAGFAVAALPNAQAAGTATPPVPAVDTPAQVVGTPPAGEGLTTFSSTTNIVRYNRLYKTPAITPSKCKEVNVSLRTVAGVQAYDQKLWNCMYAAWAVPLKAAGAAYKVKPKLVVHTGTKVNSGCGVLYNTTGYYCSANGGVIYIPAAQIINTWKQNPTYARAWATQMIAHEYGHHVQGVSGLFYARAVYLQDHPDQELESSRRNELQASCFGGVFSKAVEKSYPLTNRLNEFKEQSSNSFGETPDTPPDERTHGLATSQGFWIQNGFNIGANKACNTFAVSADLVQ